MTIGTYHKSYRSEFLNKNDFLPTNEIDSSKML